MGVELELSVLIVIMQLGTSFFAVFEVETPGWRKLTKWLIVHGGTVGLFFAVGHWALLFPLAAGALGTTVHFTWCRKHDIHPLRATPRRRYYDLRGWQWQE
ncbi:MAG: hypothetical protein IIA27_08600 [Gemmatimonadetes bacterium]|nr:hypothetical protein [Gemmatimonadota bacterium]